MRGSLGGKSILDLHTVRDMGALVFIFCSLVPHRKLLVIWRVDIHVARTLLRYTATATVHRGWIVGIITAGAFRAGAGSGGGSTTAIRRIEVRLGNMQSLVTWWTWGRGGVVEETLIDYLRTGKETPKDGQ